MENEEEQRLLARKKTLDRNRYLALALCALLGYDVYKEMKNSPPPLFFAVMAVLILAAASIAVYDTVQIKRIAKRLADIESTESLENDAGAEDDDAEER